MTIPFTDLIKISHNKSVMTYYGTSFDGRDFIAYIVCTPETAKLMYRDFSDKTSRAIAEYGEVIYKDFVSEPDDKAKDFLADYIKNNKQ